MLFLGQECYFRGRNVIVGAGILFGGQKCFFWGGRECCFGSHCGRNTMMLPKVLLMFRET